MTLWHFAVHATKEILSVHQVTLFQQYSKGPWNEVKEGVQCMLVKFFALKAAWVTFTQVVPHQTPRFV